MRNDTRNYSDFIKNYEIDRNDSKPRRWVTFMDSAADELPHEFIPREVIAKVIFDLKTVPDRDDDIVRYDLAAAVRAGRPLLEANGRYVLSGKRGMRATVDDTDAAETVLRSARVRAKKVVERCKDLHDGISIRNIRGRELKSEVAEQKKAVAVLHSTAAKLLLPAMPDP